MISFGRTPKTLAGQPFFPGRTAKSLAERRKNARGKWGRVFARLEKYNVTQRYR